MSERSYPDVDFVETDPEKMLTDLITSYEDTSGYVLQPASPEKLLHRNKPISNASPT